MSGKRFVVVLSGLALALAAVGSASAQGRHPVGSVVKGVVHAVSTSSYQGDQGNVDNGDQGNVDNGDQGNVDNGDQGNVDNGDQGNVDNGDQGTGDEGNARGGNKGN